MFIAMGTVFTNSSKALIALAFAAASAAPALADIQDNTHFNVMGAVIVWSADSVGNAPVAADFIIDTGTGGTAATSGDTDLIAGDQHTVVTGTLVSTASSIVTPSATSGIPFVIDNTTSGTVNSDSNSDGVVAADDSFSAFGLQSNSNLRVTGVETRTSFYVASNTAFAIDAEVQPPTTFLNFALLILTDLTMQVTLNGDDGLAFGSAAQFPHSGGATSGFTAGTDLFSLIGGQTVFTGDQRTAATPGTLAEQSVRFDNTYTIGASSLTGYDLSLGTFDFSVQVSYTVFVP